MVCSLTEIALVTHRCSNYSISSSAWHRFLRRSWSCAIRNRKLTGSNSCGREIWRQTRRRRKHRPRKRPQRVSNVSAFAGRLGWTPGPPAMPLGCRPGIWRAPFRRRPIRDTFCPRGRLPLLLLARRPSRARAGRAVLALLWSTTWPGGVLALLRLPWQAVGISIGLTVSRSQGNFELDNFIPLRIAAIALGDGEKFTEPTTRILGR